MKPLMRKASLAFLLVIILVSLAGCGTKNPLYGKWEEPVSGVTMEIVEGGDIKMTLHGATFTMQYELQDPNILILKASADGTIPDTKMTYTATKDKLTITVDGVDTIFNRAK